MGLIDKSQISGTTTNEVIQSVVDQLKRYGYMAVSDEVGEEEIKKMLDYCKPENGFLHNSIAERFIYCEFEFTIREYYYDSGSEDYVYTVYVWKF